MKRPTMGSSVDIGDLNRYGRLTAGAAIVAVIALFLPWYGSASAFDSGFLAWAGMLVAIGGAVVVLLETLDIHDTTLGRLTSGQLSIGMAVLGTLMVVARLATGGPGAGGARFGLFVGLVAAAAISYGCYHSQRR